MTPAPADAPAPDGGVSALTGLVLILGLIAAAGAFQEAAANAWAAIYVENVRDGGPFLAGLSAAAFTLGLTVGRLGAHEIEHRFRALAVTAVAAGIAGASFIAIATGVPLNIAVALFSLAGVGVGPIEPAVFRAVATRTDGPVRGRTLATVTAIAYLGYLISPPALGLVADGFGWTAFWVASAAASAGAGILALRMMAMGRQSL